VVDVPFNKISNDTSQQITTLLYIKRARALNKSHIISTDEDPGLRIESFAVINLRGVSTNKTIICFIAMQTYKELKTIPLMKSFLSNEMQFENVR
jgi:hypothetical protein